MKIIIFLWSQLMVSQSQPQVYKRNAPTFMDFQKSDMDAEVHLGQSLNSFGAQKKKSKVWDCKNTKHSFLHILQAQSISRTYSESLNYPKLSIKEKILLDNEEFASHFRGFAKFNEGIFYSLLKTSCYKYSRKSFDEEFLIGSLISSWRAHCASFPETNSMTEPSTLN